MRAVSRWLTIGASMYAARPCRLHSSNTSRMDMLLVLLLLLSFDGI